MAIVQVLPFQLIFFIALQVPLGYLVAHFYRRFKSQRDRAYLGLFCVAFLANVFTLLRELFAYLGPGFSWQVSLEVLVVAAASLAIGRKLDREAH